MRVAVMGAGFGAFAHVPAWKRHPDVTEIGICASTKGKTTRIAKEHGITPIHSLDAAADTQRWDIASIALPPKEQGEMLMKCLTAGQAVFCEKSIGTYANGLSEIRAFLDSRENTPFAMNMGFRELPAWRSAKAVIRSGILGKIDCIRSYWSICPIPKKKTSWKGDWTKGGHPMESFFPHVIDYLLYFSTEQKDPSIRCHDIYSADTVPWRWETKFNIAPRIPGTSKIVHYSRNGTPQHTVTILGQGDQMITLENTTPTYMNGWKAIFSTAKSSVIIHQDKEEGEPDGRQETTYKNTLRLRRMMEDNNIQSDIHRAKAQVSAVAWAMKWEWVDPKRSP